MKVEELLETKGSQVIRVRPDIPLWGALGKFRSHEIGALVVSEMPGTIDGMLSERDVVAGLLRHGAGLLDLTVRDVMSDDVPLCAPDDTIATVMQIMTTRRTRHLPVVDDGGGLRGIVSIGDVVKARLDEADLENRVLRDLHASRR